MQTSQVQTSQVQTSQVQTNMCEEIEVYRLTPKKGILYFHAEATRKTGKYPNEKYFTTNRLQYVGEYVTGYRTNSGDGGFFWDIFNDDGVEKRVYYSYEGNTCFFEAVNIKNN